MFNTHLLSAYYVPDIVQDAFTHYVIYVLWVLLSPVDRNSKVRPSDMLRVAQPIPRRKPDKDSDILLQV